MLKRLLPQDVVAGMHDPIDAATLAQAQEIVCKVQNEGEPALRRISIELGDIEASAPLVLQREALKTYFTELPQALQETLQRMAKQIEAFAKAQRASLLPMEMAVPGGQAGHVWAPMQRAGCYAPGGRFALPSSVLMTAITARVAGVSEIWVASPRPKPATLAAAWLAGADGVLCVGGAQAIAALAFGVPGVVPPCDAVVGPGNRFVTAAKQHVAGKVAIDMLAGPSELLVVADKTADPACVAADLLAQAEHDPDALPCVVLHWEEADTKSSLNSSASNSETWLSALDAALAKQLASLPTADTAKASLKRGFACVVSSIQEGAAVVDRVGPEHLELQVASPDAWQPMLMHYGALFIGAAAAEVFGDYGVGPNHVLPTGGGARLSGGLSVLNFLRLRTWLRMDPTAEAFGQTVEDSARLARVEGLEGHARAAEYRLNMPGKVMAAKAR